MFGAIFAAFAKIGRLELVFVSNAVSDDMARSFSAQTNNVCIAGLCCSRFLCTHVREIPTGGQPTVRKGTT